MRLFVIVVFSEDNLNVSIRTCYTTTSGPKGWCATCDLTNDHTNPHACLSERWEPATLSADSHWGWCNHLCDEDHESLPHHLQEVTLVIFPAKDCIRMLNVTGGKFGPDKELCAGYVSKRRRKFFAYDGGKFRHLPHKKEEFDLIGGKDACTGDSGGPLWIEMGRKTRRAFIVGVVSRGFNCASHNKPGIYTRVKDFIKWIGGVMEEDGKCKNVYKI